MKMSFNEEGSLDLLLFARESKLLKFVNILWLCYENENIIVQ